MPAQFTRMRAVPLAASPFAIAALTSSSLVTSPTRATPFTSAATFSAFSLLWSSTAILAPLAAIARAVAAPRPEPPPVMRTETSFNCMTKPFLGRFLKFFGCSNCSLDAFLLFCSPLSGDGFLIIRRQHAAKNQRFHMRDVIAAHLVGDGARAGGARHRMPAEEQVIAGADQAGIKQHRIDAAEFAGGDAFRQQAALEIQERPDKEF